MFQELFIPCSVKFQFVSSRKRFVSVDRYFDALTEADQVQEDPDGEGGEDREDGADAPVEMSWTRRCTQGGLGGG